MHADRHHVDGGATHPPRATTAVPSELPMKMYGDSFPRKTFVRRGWESVRRIRWMKWQGHRGKQRSTPLQIHSSGMSPCRRDWNIFRVFDPKQISHRTSKQLMEPAFLWPCLTIKRSNPKIGGRLGGARMPRLYPVALREVLGNRAPDPYTNCRILPRAPCRGTQQDRPAS